MKNHMYGQERKWNNDVESANEAIYGMKFYEVNAFYSVSFVSKSKLFVGVSIVTEEG